MPPDSTDGLTRFWRVGLAASVLVAGWMTVRFGQFAHGSAGTRPHHIQTAATILAALVVLTAAARAGGVDNGERQARHFGWLYLVGFVLASIGLYWPAVSVGLLSDDFVLLARAEHGQWGAVSASLVRPLVMVIWTALLRAGLDSASLHLFNIVVHGVVAYVAVRLVADWIRVRALAIAAGLIVLSHPVAVEAVVWVSGAFDLVATLLVLATVLTARRYGAVVSYRTRLTLFGFAIAAALAKETAVVAAMLIAIDALIVRIRSRTLAIDTAVIAIGAVVYSVIRLRGTPEAEAFALTKYTAQRALFQTIGGLAQPWPADVRATAGAMAGLIALVVIVLAFAWTARRARLRPVLGACAWVLVAVAPVVGWIMIGPQLDGTRYLYLALPAWSGLVAAMAIGGAALMPRQIAAAALVAMIGLNVIVTRRQIGAWSEAASVRDRVLTAVAGDARVRTCVSVRIDGLPDTVGGVYVFRNGAAEALAGLGAPPLSGAAPPPCQFRWDSVESMLR